MRRGFQPIRVTEIDITRLTHVVWKCFVRPQNVNLLMVLNARGKAMVKAAQQTVIP